MKAPIDPRLHWTDYYVQFGFAVVKRIIDQDFIQEALEEVRRLVGSKLPFNHWTKDNINIPNGSASPVLAKIFDQPRVRAAIDEMFGSPDQWNGDRSYSLFLKPYDPKAKRELLEKGHIDFVEVPIPVLGSGLMMQVSLLDKEPFGGNITIWPGTHRIVQKCAMENPRWRYPGNWDDIPKVEPFEFVAGAGDALFFHHLVAHQGNPCCTRTPRISLHCQALRKEWLPEIDPKTPGLSPWERSLSLNGYYKPPRDEKTMMEEGYRVRKEAKEAETAMARA